MNRNVEIKGGHGAGAWLFLFAAVAFRAVTQTLFKQIAVEGHRPLFELLSSWPVYLAGFAVILRVITWQKALATFPLSIAYPFTGISFLAILLSGAFFFNETVTIENLLGVCFIIFGLFVISTGRIIES